MTREKKAADMTAVNEDSRSCSGLKLSTFWPDSAEVWFAQADAQFEIRSISSSRSKFYHAVAALPQDVAGQVLDLIRAPPRDDHYLVLRTRLVRLFNLNEYQRFEALVSLSLSGDQKPSYLMNRMLALYPDDVKPDFVFRGLFLRRLPVEMRAHLLRESIDDPIEMALKADELHQNRVSSAAANILASSPDDALVNTVTNHPRVPPRSSAVSNPQCKRSPTPASSARSSTSGFCWYHVKHAEAATNCREPCSYFPGNE